MNKRQTKKREKMVRQYLSEHPYLKYRLVDELKPVPLVQTERGIVALWARTEVKAYPGMLEDERLTDRGKKELAECFARSEELMNCITIHKAISPYDPGVFVFQGYLDLLAHADLDPNIPLITVPDIEPNDVCEISEEQMRRLMEKYGNK